MSFRGIGVGWATERELAWLSKASVRLGSGDRRGESPWLRWWRGRGKRPAGSPCWHSRGARESGTGRGGGASALGSLGLAGSWPRARRARGAWHKSGSWVLPGLPTPPWWPLSLHTPAPPARSALLPAAEMLAWPESWSGLDQQLSHPGDGSRHPRHGGLREHAPGPRCHAALKFHDEAPNRPLSSA